jgi:hypothetical protein
MTAWGQTSTHLPHWMQSSSSQAGIFQGDVALLPLRGAGGIGSIDGHFADREIVAIAEDHGRQNILHEGGRWAGTGGRKLDGAGGLGRNLDAMEVARVASTAAKFFCTTASPRLP